MEKCYIGVDVGGTTVKIGCFDSKAVLLYKYEIPTRTEENGKYILEDIVLSLKKEHCFGDIMGIGIGVPGPVTDDGTVLNCINLGWGIVNVPCEVKKYIDVPAVKAGNDANMAALGEMFMGAGAGSSDVAMLTLGTGVGGGIVRDGRIVNGIHGAAGEIGHMPVVYDDNMPLCNCGKRGCLEQVASATGIVRTTKEILNQTKDSSVLRDMECFTAKDVFDAAKEKDVLALKAVDKLAFYLGVAMANIACVMDPEVFIIGGGVSAAGDILLEKVAEEYRKKAFNPSKGTAVRLATLGNDAGIYGAVKLVLD